MNRLYFANHNFERGQGLVEYALILVLIALVVIVALAILGPRVANVFSQISNELLPYP
jgi:pilus assembly protein Flp/PilA